MRHLLWWAQKCHGMKPPPPPPRQTWCPEIYLPVDDWTDDVDTPADVAHLGELADLARQEERRDEALREDREARQFARD